MDHESKLPQELKDLFVKIHQALELIGLKLEEHEKEIKDLKERMTVEESRG